MRYASVVEELVVPMMVSVRPEAGSVSVVWVLAIGLKRLATLLWMLLSMLADLINLCATFVLINLIYVLHQSIKPPIFCILACSKQRDVKGDICCRWS